MRRGHRGAALDRIIAIVPGRQDVDPRRGDIGGIAVLGEVEVSTAAGGVHQGLVGAGSNRQYARVRSRVHRLARVEVPCRGDHHYTVGDRVLDGRLGVRVRAAICRRQAAGLICQGQIDHPGTGGDGVVDPGRLVHGVAVPPVVKDLDIEGPGVPAQAGYSQTVVGVGRDQAGDERTVPIVVPGRSAQRPVDGTDIWADGHLAGQLGMGNVGSGVEHGHHHIGTAPGDAPGLGGIDRPQV